MLTLQEQKVLSSASKKQILLHAENTPLNSKRAIFRALTANDNIITYRETICSYCGMIKYVNNNTGKMLKYYCQDFIIAEYEVADETRKIEIMAQILGMKE